MIGNEGKGLGRLVREKCDVIVSLPMKGKINSLNARRLRREFSCIKRPKKIKRKETGGMDKERLNLELEIDDILSEFSKKRPLLSSPPERFRTTP